MKRYGNPQILVTDRCPSYRAAMKDIGNQGRQEVGRHLNNRAENSHLPFRRKERARRLVRIKLTTPNLVFEIQPYPRFTHSSQAYPIAAVSGRR